MERKYEEVIKYIEELASSNQLRQGGRLPSIRSLAAQFKCNKSTIIRAYTELEANHEIYSIPKSGYYLVEKNPSYDSEYATIDFSAVMPDPKLLPYKEFNHCINKAVELYKKSLFCYSDRQGLESLRKVLVKHFIENQIFTSKENIFVTAGSQQALSLLSKMSFPNDNKLILVEQPTYNLMLKLVDLNKDKLIGINRTAKGIDFHELERIFSTGNIKFFYTIPRFHNPLGLSYSEKEKKKIVKLAEKYDVYIVEDDYLVDIDPNKKAFPLSYYDISDKVIYVKSFSKAFMPGIRIGAAILPQKLHTEFLNHKICSDLSTSVLAQGALEIFINSGMYKNHIKKAQVEYKKKMICLKECLNNLNTKGIEFSIPETGFFLWVKLPSHININILMKRLEEKNIYIIPAENFFIGNVPNENSFRICISKLSKEEIKLGICLLFKEINKLKEQQK